MKRPSLQKIIRLPEQELLKVLWMENPEIRGILKESSSLSDARDSLFDLMNRIDRQYYNIHSAAGFLELPQLEKDNAKECIRIVKNIMRTENERLTGFSALQVLHGLAKGHAGLSETSSGFLCEFIFLFRGVYGKSGIYAEKTAPTYLKMRGRAAALKRSGFLDSYSKMMSEHFRKYRSGTDKKLVEKRAAAKGRILGFFSASNEDWLDYEWHLKNVICSADVLKSIVPLSKKEEQGLRRAEELKINFQITPYYLSLFSFDRSFDDSAIRAQVLPSARYCETINASIKSHADLDFMEEGSTSPVRAITRRYPQIVILKPFESCPQICVYCQRNWEITSLKKAASSRVDLKPALRWLKKHPSITEVLVTGGDPLTLPDDHLDHLFKELAGFPQIERIRIGTRTPVTLPFRITDQFVDMASKYHEPGKREVCIITHFEHASEITPDAVSAVTKVRRKGMSVYNQQVFTYYNSKKFETAFLRKMLKLCGVDPYYLFNTKGKKETVDFRVPIARVLQERKEEARLLPGTIRTDEPVFNVPRLGKSHLRSWQEHEVIMVRPGGERVYRFFPWESKLSLVEPYRYEDVPIYDYLARLDRDGQDVAEYSTIWYYF